MRVLKWIVERCQGQAQAVERPLGWMPAYGDLDWKGLDGVDEKQFDQLMEVDTKLWDDELRAHGELFDKLKSRLPRQFALKRELFQLSLWNQE